jgi:hypothetical protein
MRKTRHDARLTIEATAAIVEAQNKNPSGDDVHGGYLPMANTST